MNHMDVLEAAKSLLGPRGEVYGSPKDNFKRIADIAAVILGREVSEYEVAVFLLSTKLGRIPNDPSYRDSYVDGINYLAFMAEFSDGVLK